MQIFDIVFDVTLNKLLRKQPSSKWIEAIWCSWNVTEMYVDD